LFSQTKSKNAASDERQRRDLMVYQSPPRLQYSRLRDCFGNDGNWIRLTCRNCGLSFATPIAPFAIRYGMNAPADYLTAKPKCEVCGSRAFLVRRPSLQGQVGDWHSEPFPVDQGYCAVTARVREHKAKMNADRASRGLPPV
jgi:hypothetical protein